MPQSMQSVPCRQYPYSAPGPPSLHSPSPLYPFAPPPFSPGGIRLPVAHVWVLARMAARKKSSRDTYIEYDAPVAGFLWKRRRVSGIGEFVYYLVLPVLTGARPAPRCMNIRHTFKKHTSHGRSTFAMNTGCCRTRARIPLREDTVSCSAEVDSSCF